MTAYLPIHRRKLITSPDVSRGELLLFRLIERLSTGRAGCVRNFATLAEMLERCERQAWTLFGRLVKAGWIAYRTFRKSGKSYFEFWPVVRVAERSAPVFERRPRLVKEASETSFLAPKTAPTTALSTPKNCTLVEGAYKTLLTAKQEDSKQTTVLTEAQSDAVSLLAESAQISIPEAQSIANDPQVQTATKGLSKSTIKHILTCFQAAKARGSVIRPGAWLRAALRSPESYSAPVAAPTHPSEAQGTEEARTVRIPKDQPFWSAQTEQNVKWSKPSEAGLEKLPPALREKMLAKRKGLGC